MRRQPIGHHQLYMFDLIVKSYRLIVFNKKKLKSFFFSFLEGMELAHNLNKQMLMNKQLAIILNMRIKLQSMSLNLWDNIHKFYGLYLNLKMKNLCFRQGVEQYNICLGLAFNSPSQNLEDNYLFLVLEFQFTLMLSRCLLVSI